MQYFVTFLEGLITFISPCVLPMLPVYLLYFAGDAGSTGAKKGRALRNSLGFCAGFTVIFVALGLFAATLNRLLLQYQTAVNLVCGAAVIIFGLHYMGILHIGFLSRTFHLSAEQKPTGFFSAVIFGLVFAVGWSPCVGVFLGSALLLAASQTGWFTGMLLLLCFSAGLAVPFVLSAVLLESLQGAFGFIKKHYVVVNRVSGAFLVVIGILMAAGLFTRLSNFLR